jgi:hypothetical protein
MVINEPFYATILSVASFSMSIDMNSEGVQQKVKKTLDHHCLQLSMVAKKVTFALTTQESKLVIA